MECFIFVLRSRKNHLIFTHSTHASDTVIPLVTPSPIPLPPETYSGSGCEATWLDASHLRFMKDISVLFGLSRTRTFGHFTSLLHPERLNWLFRRHYSKSLRRGFDEWGGKRGVIERCALEIEHRHAENAEANDRVSRRLRHH